MKDCILTLLAVDQPGITEAVAQLISAHQGHWLESRMVSLAGRFAGIARVRLPTNQVDALQAALQLMADSGIAAQLQSTEHPGPVEPTHRLELVGNDRPGIVKELSSTLATAGISIVELQTKIEAASMSGGFIFRATADCKLSETDSLSELITALEALSPELMVDCKAL